MNDSKINLKKQITGIAVIVVLAAVTLYVLINETKSFNLEMLFDFFREVNIWCLAGCVLCVISAIFFEGYSLKLIVNRLGYKINPIKSMMWAAADYYFSGITPSASGGQPASAYFMNKDGVPYSKSSAALVFNIFEFMLSLMVIGAVCIIISPSLFFNSDSLVKGFLIFGFIVGMALVTLCLLCMFKRSWIENIGRAVIALLSKLHVFKHPDSKRESLSRMLDDYDGAVSVVKGNPTLIFSVFITNTIQRAFTAFTVCLLYIGVTGSTDLVPQIFALNILCIVAVSCVPIPGAVGISELVFFRMFEGIFKDNTAAVMLTNRVITFYLCIVFCGLWTIIKMIKVKSKGNKKC